MNGPIAFARTLRALDADDFRISNIALFLAVALLAGWTAWLFGARVPQYETAQDARVEAPAGVRAHFTASAGRQVRLGQPAVVDAGGPRLRGEVAGVQEGVQDGIEVELSLGEGSDVPPGSSHVTVHVEVGRVSPASIVLRAIGRARR